MILPDVNVLVYAFHRDAPRHREYKAWLDGAVVEEGLAVNDIVLTGFVRIATNPRVFSDPAPTPVALELVDRIRDARRTQWLAPTPEVWERFARIVDADTMVRGNLVPDAWLAALALAHGARLATADRGVARYEGLDWFTPVS
ncbi:MAG: TA system VapC family ribonuclease toxin [Actinomycetota bacterium]|nr:TA system VapC family ribonuclease toxin [Actinomycetota bacterium]